MHTGLNHMILLLGDSSVCKNGCNVHGQLGDKTKRQTLFLIKLEDFLLTDKDISAGSHHSMFVMEGD